MLEAITVIFLIGIIFEETRAISVSALFLIGFAIAYPFFFIMTILVIGGLAVIVNK